MSDDPCDDMWLFWWEVDGVKYLCRARVYDSGVSPLGPWSIQWKYEVVETSFIPYGVYRCVEAVPVWGITK